MHPLQAGMGASAAAGGGGGAQPGSRSCSTECTRPGASQGQGQRERTAVRAALQVPALLLHPQKVRLQRPAGQWQPKGRPRRRAPRLLRSCPTWTASSSSGGCSRGRSRCRRCRPPAAAQAARRRRRPSYPCWRCLRSTAQLTAAAAAQPRRYKAAAPPRRPQRPRCQAWQALSATARQPAAAVACKPLPAPAAPPELPAPRRLGSFRPCPRCCHQTTLST